MATEKYSNAPQTTLDDSDGINSSDTVVVVTSATGFPTSGNFRILIDSEIMKVTAVSGTTFTVVRAQEGTSAVSHVNLATITQVLTTGSLSQILSDAVSKSDFASIPANERDGKIAFLTDQPVVGRDNGSTYDYFGLVHPFTTPPASGTWTWVNQGTATVTQQGHSVILRDPGTASRQGRLLVKTVPTAPYTITACMMPYLLTSSGTNPCEAGLVLYESGTGKLVYMTQIDFATSRKLGYYKQNSVTSFNSEYGTAPQVQGPMPLFWVRIVDNGTNRSFYWSLDGQNWELVQAAVSRTDFITPNQIGFFVDCNSCNSPISNRLLSWKEE